jgi:uncharacterized protein (DUF1330 family)
MSAYVVVEFTVKDPEMYREKYAPIAGQTAKEHGGEVIAAGNWEVLHGDGSLTSGALVRFTDRETALRWYNSPEYQQLIDVRSAAMDARFRLLDGLSLQTGRRQPQISTLPRRRYCAQRNSLRTHSPAGSRPAPSQVPPLTRHGRNAVHRPGLRGQRGQAADRPCLAWSGLVYRLAPRFGPGVCGPAAACACSGSWHRPASADIASDAT